jgi:hypothetical protein
VDAFKKRRRLAVSERKTLCDLGMVTVDYYSGSDAGNTFRLTFRHRSGQQTGRIDVDRVEAEQFAAELAAAMTAIIAQLKSSQYML